MRLFILTVCVIFFVGCKSDSDNIPKDIIAKDKMGKIFWDLIQADQFSIQYLVKDTARAKTRAETMRLYEEVFRIHHITKDEFKKSFQFYLAHPEITKSMFDSLSTSANRQRIEMFKNQPKLPKKPV
jgi:hypothetical protein